MTLSSSYLRYQAYIQLVASNCRILSSPIITIHLFISLILLPFKQYSAPSRTTFLILQRSILFQSSFQVDFQHKQRLSQERQMNLFRGSVFFIECFIIKQPFLRLQRTSLIDYDSELSSLFLEGELDNFFFKQISSSRRRISTKARESKSLILTILLAVLGGRGQLEEALRFWICINYSKSNNRQEINDLDINPKGKLQNLSIYYQSQSVVLSNGRQKIEDLHQQSCIKQRTSVRHAKLQKKKMQLNQMNVSIINIEFG